MQCYGTFCFQCRATYYTSWVRPKGTNIWFCTICQVDGEWDMPHKPVPETLVGTLTQEWAGIIWCTYVETVQGKAIPQVLVEYLVQSVW